MRRLLQNRFVIFFLYLGLLIGGEYLFTGSFLPSTDTRDLWFYSGLFMILFSILFIEPYYTSPKNVITNTIPLLLVLMSTKNDFYSLEIWWWSLGLVGALLIFAILPLLLEDINRSPLYIRNKLANIIKNLVVLVGSGKILYSAAFILFLMMNIFSAPSEKFYQVFDLHFLFLMVMWGLILSIDPSTISNTFRSTKIKVGKNAIGEIIGVQSRKIFLARLFEDRKSIRRFDIVKFRYSMQDSHEYQMSGIVFDTYLLNQERWAKILHLGRIKVSAQSMDNNTVYIIEDKAEKEKLEVDLNVDRFVGVVTKGTNIGTLRFDYSKRTNDIQEGDLLELDFEGRRLFYQVINGQTKIENLEARNEIDFVEGEAIQLGEWDSGKLAFQKFGWVPSINTPLFIADTTTLEIPNHNHPEHALGIIPGTQIPSVINLHDAVSHHLALLGVTGSGKSFLAKRLIEKLTVDTRVICVDFTGEWKKDLGDEKIQILNKDNTDDFLDASDNKIGIVELPSLSNTIEVISATEKMLSQIFNAAKAAYDTGSPKRICLVLEEAHTIVPEGSFLGVNDWNSKAVVNKMGQIALQGRKYGVGLMVIAQRTANVSKTVLTQCNTVICFQAFDETSFNFLGNYIGAGLARSLPNLKKYHAIVTGKAIKTNLPMIIDMEVVESDDLESKE